jgi:hypothetical protein
MLPRKITCIVSTCLGLLGAAGSADVAYEPFAYPASTTLHGQAGGSGFSGAWVEDGIMANFDLIDAGGMWFGFLRESGQSVASRGPSGGMTNLFRALTPIAGTDGTTLWIGFLLRKRSSGGTPPEDFAGVVLYPSAGDGLFVGDPSENDFYSLGVAGSGEGLAPSSHAPGETTALLVIRIAFHSGPETIDLFVNPKPGISAPAIPGARKTSFSLTDVSAVGLLAGSTDAQPLWSIDEFRIGESFDAVAPAELLQVNVAVAPAGTAVSWETLPGRSYQAWWSDDLVAWQTLGPVLAGDGGVKTVTDSVVTPARFYRVRVQ